MEILKEALERNGFTYSGPCKICGGRGFEYKRDRAIAKVKKGDRGQELNMTISGWGVTGRRIIPTRFDIKIPAHVQNVDRLIQNTIGLTNEQETEQTNG